jgi:Protein tyrosine and serine/threonine kinase
MAGRQRRELFIIFFLSSYVSIYILQDRNTVLRRAIARQPWELNHKMLTREAKLGEGQFGDVYSGTLQRSDESPKIRVAIKYVSAFLFLA